MAPGDSRSTRILALAAAAFLLAAAAIGIWLRLGLGGIAPVPATFGFVRHAHSHGAIYGVLFPLLWITWRREGLPAPGPRVALVYVLASVVATIAFWSRGYFGLSIAASTVVGAVWLRSAWCARAAVVRGPELLRAGPPGILVAAALVPAIAVLTRRDPILANHLVHTFIALLLLVVLVPVALARIGSPRLPAVALATLGLVSALFLGVAPGRATGLGLAAFGVVVGFAALRATGDPIARASFGVLAAGSVVLGLLGGRVPHAAAVGGLHYMALGPLLVSLAPPAPALARALLVVAAAAMAGVLVGTVLGLPAAPAQTAAAVAGIALLPPALAGLVRLRDDPT